MPLGARLFVPAPPFTPAQYGLLSVAQVTTEADPHWQAGVMYQPDVCDTAHVTLDPCPPPVTGTAKTPTSSDLPAKGADAVTVYAWIDCGPPGGIYEQAQARAAAALTAGEPYAFERAFWTGQVDQPAGQILYPHLAANQTVVSQRVTIQPAAAVPVTGAVDIVEAIGVLEETMAACYGGVPIIHVPRRALAHLSLYGLVERQGQQLRTLGGSLIAAGAGYPGTGPDGVKPPYPQAWLYATGAVTVRRGDIRYTSSPAAAVGRATNDLVLIAERTYVAGWDCCLAAVLVNLGGIIAGQPNTAT